MSDDRLDAKCDVNIARSGNVTDQSGDMTGQSGPSVQAGYGWATLPFRLHAPWRTRWVWRATEPRDRRQEPASFAGLSGPGGALAGAYRQRRLVTTDDQTGR